MPNRESNPAGVQSITVEMTFATELGFDDIVVGAGMFMDFFRQDQSVGSRCSVTVSGDTVVLAVESDGSVIGQGYTIERITYVP